MNISDYLSRQYSNPPCWELVADIYRTELDEGVMGFKTVDPSVRAIASAFRLALHKSPHGFARIEDPVDYAVVLMGKSEALGVHHCGIWYQGKILHALETGNLYQDVASLSDTYKVMEFWAKP